MGGLFWLVLFGFATTIGGLLWYVVRKAKARKLAEEERFANFMADTTGKAKSAEPLPAPMPAPARAPAGGDGLAQQKMLFEAAHKAGEAGEPALAIQLYARLLARYPDSAFTSQARAAAEMQKKRLAKA